MSNKKLDFLPETTFKSKKAVVEFLVEKNINKDEMRDLLAYFHNEKFTFALTKGNELIEMIKIVSKED